MSLIGRLFGRREEGDRRAAVGDRLGRGTEEQAAPAALTDEQAIARYRYLLRTAPPETVEEAHAEAFAQLTPEQRRLVLTEVSQSLPASERSTAGGDDPRALARLATRAEMRQPGTLERAFGGMTGPGVGMGGLMAGGFLGSMAGVVLGSMVAQSFLNDAGYDQGLADGSAAGEATDASAGVEADAAGVETYEAGAGGDLNADFGSDLGGDFGDGFGSDFS